MTTEEQAQPAKRQRNRAAVQPIRLQERDLDMPLSISVGRYLSVPAIEWLHTTAGAGPAAGANAIRPFWRSARATLAPSTTQRQTSIIA